MKSQTEGRLGADEARAAREDGLKWGMEEATTVAEKEAESA